MPEMPSIRFTTVCLDCPDAQAMTRFYGGLLGWEPTVTEPEWVLMRDPSGGTGLSFQQDDRYQPPVWPGDPPRQQKMMHLEVCVTPPGTAPGGGYSAADGQAALAAAVGLALSLGGRLAARQFREDLRVILDPAGHPLCLFLG